MEGEKKSKCAGCEVIFVVPTRKNAQVIARLRPQPAQSNIKDSVGFPSRLQQLASLSYGRRFGALTTLVCGPALSLKARETNPLISAASSVIHIKGRGG